MRISNANSLIFYGRYLGSGILFAKEIEYSLRRHWEPEGSCESYLGTRRLSRNLYNTLSHYSNVFSSIYRQCHPNTFIGSTFIAPKASSHSLPQFQQTNSTSLRYQYYADNIANSNSNIHKQINQ